MKLRKLAKVSNAWSLAALCGGLVSPSVLGVPSPGPTARGRLAGPGEKRLTPSGRAQHPCPQGHTRQSRLTASRPQASVCPPRVSASPSPSRGRPGEEPGPREPAQARGGEKQPPAGARRWPGLRAAPRPVWLPPCAQRGWRCGCRCRKSLWPRGPRRSP